MNQKINVAIDGYSSCGKSTIARQLAKRLNYIYLDSGAMYRAVTLYFLKNDVDFNDSESVLNALDNIRLDVDYNNGENLIYLNGELLGNEIRTMDVSNMVSAVAEKSAVRKFLVKQQQLVSEKRGVVMDGRDIGTVVMPDAELKLFVTADKEVRVTRRYEELRNKGIEITREEVRRNLEQRDFTDTHRQDSPLVKAPDALILDNTHLTIEQQLEWVLGKVNEIIEQKNKS